jgi:DNA-directed RNA polymerase subunit K/omega
VNGNASQHVKHRKVEVLVIDTWGIDRGLKITGSRFLLAVLLAKRAKRIMRRRYSKSLAICVEQALQEIVAGKIRVLLPQKFANIFIKHHQAFIEEYQGGDDLNLLSLFALGRANLEQDGWGYVGQVYSIQVGISASEEKGFITHPFNIKIKTETQVVPFDFLIHVTGNLEVIGDWHKHLSYEVTGPQPQLVDFSVKITKQGDNVVTVDCYHERRWLRTMRFEFEGVEVKTLKASI